MSPEPAPIDDGAISPSPRKRRYLLWICAVAVLAAIAGVYVWKSRVLPIQAVAVRPFAAAGGPAWLAGAITEEIVDALRPVTQPAADPAFSAVLEGSVTPANGRIRVIATLTRADGHRYWTRTFDRPVTGIAVEVAAAIKPAVRKRAAQHNPPAPVYERYLEARQLWDGNDFAKAIDGFDAAAQGDPGFALASAWLAIAKESLTEQGAARPNELLPAARDAAERAVTIDPANAATHLALGIIRLQYDWDWDSARREFDRALELSPGDPLAIRWSRRWLEVMKRAPATPLQLPNVPRDADAARRLLADADDLRSRAYVSPATFVLAACVAHDTESLFRWLDVAYEDRSVHLPSLLRDPALPQSDPRLLELMRQLNLPANP
jgi:hypothetical protein